MTHDFNKSFALSYYFLLYKYRGKGEKSTFTYPKFELFWWKQTKLFGCNCHHIISMSWFMWQSTLLKKLLLLDPCIINGCIPSRGNKQQFLWLIFLTHTVWLTMTRFQISFSWLWLDWITNKKEFMFENWWVRHYIGQLQQSPFTTRYVCIWVTCTSSILCGRSIRHRMESCDENIFSRTFWYRKSYITRYFCTSKFKWGGWWNWWSATMNRCAIHSSVVCCQHLNLFCIYWWMVEWCSCLLL